MNRLELPLFPIMLGLSALGHGVIFIIGFLLADRIIPPQVSPPQPGRASVKVFSSESSRIKPADLPPDLPKLEDPVNPPPLPDPTLVLPKALPMARPRERVEPKPMMLATRFVTPAEIPELSEQIPIIMTPLETVKSTAPPQQTMERPRTPTEPKLTPDQKMSTPVEIPDLRTDLAKPIPPKNIEKHHDPLKPVSMTRPKETTKVEMPKMEAVVKIADTVAVPQQASDASEGVDELPMNASNPPPPYPEEARQLKQFGTVKLLVNVSADGRATTISIYSSSGYQSLDDSALTTVRRWVFTPARRAGRPIAYEIVVPIVFYFPR